MPERVASDSPLAQTIRSEIAGFIKEGCVLSIQDLNEIAAKYGISSGTYIMDHLTRTFGARIGSSENHQDVYYDIAGVATTRTRYKRHRLLVSRDLPLDQTNWEEVTQNIDAKFRNAGIKSRQTQQTFRT